LRPEAAVWYSIDIRMVVLMAENKRIFDYEALSRKYGIEPEVLNRIVKETHNEFGEDEMMVKEVPALMEQLEDLLKEIKI
jgi:DNA repair ATPase RecN